MFLHWSCHIYILLYNNTPLFYIPTCYRMSTIANYIILTLFHTPTCYRMSTIPISGYSGIALQPYIIPTSRHAIACLRLLIIPMSHLDMLLHVYHCQFMLSFLPPSRVIHSWYPYGYTSPHMSIGSYIDHTRLSCNIYSSLHLVLTFSSTQFILYVYR